MRRITAALLQEFGFGDFKYWEDLKQIELIKSFSNLPRDVKVKHHIAGHYHFPVNSTSSAYNLMLIACPQWKRIFQGEELDIRLHQQWKVMDLS
jgi:hypothetical protein